MNAQAWGTPRQIREKLVHWREVLGRFDMIVGFRAAGIAYADAEGSMHLFAPAAKQPGTKGRYRASPSSISSSIFHASASQSTSSDSRPRSASGAASSRKKP